MQHTSQYVEGVTRRSFLSRIGMGFPALALADLLQGAPDIPGGNAGALTATAARRPHFTPKAKHVIHLFLNGGPSQVDTFDPKPALKKYAGKPLGHRHLQTERKTGSPLPSPFRFQRCGKSGLEISEIFPHLADCADDLTVIRSMQCDVPNHEPAVLLMNCGDGRLVRPSMGSWVLYGLGTENQNLPGFLSLCPGGYPNRGAENWRSSFLPGAFQGTFIDSKETAVEKLIANIKNDHNPLGKQRRQLDLLLELNRQHLEERGNDAALESRIQSFELAYRMQVDASDVFDLSDEPRHIMELYGDDVQGRQHLIARRLIERGVRFVQVWHGSGQPWDAHDNVEKNHRQLAGNCDRAIAALLKDLKQRGLLEETLVVCGGEFGRTPTIELPIPSVNGGSGLGRDHNHYAFSMWLAGGGVKGGTAYGATDELGFQATQDIVHVHDLHATILHLLGLDHKNLTYRYSGRDFRLTDVYGDVVHDIIA